MELTVVSGHYTICIPRRRKSCEIRSLPFKQVITADLQLFLYFASVLKGVGVFPTERDMV